MECEGLSALGWWEQPGEPSLEAALVFPEGLGLGQTPAWSRVVQQGGRRWETDASAGATLASCGAVRDHVSGA